MREQTPPSGNEFLGIADPRPVVGNWPDLPHARDEVQRIAELFDPAGRTVLVAEAASKSRLRALDLHRFGFIHFATHGWMDGSDLRQTGLVLSANEERAGAGLLALDEVLDLSLSARTVVLSACRSGLGEPLRGEGLIGLTGGFLYAGADSVLVSLWNVEDRATSDLMLRFYRGIRGGSDPAAALRQAKLELINVDRRSRGGVHQWAPFVFVGAPRPAD
jgi:CHAT domain-containing protein